MPVKKPSSQLSLPSFLTRKRIKLIIFVIALLGAGVWAWRFWSDSGKDTPQLRYILFEKNAEQIEVPANESLQAGPQDQLKILEINTIFFITRVSA